VAPQVTRRRVLDSALVKVKPAVASRRARLHARVFDRRLRPEKAVRGASANPKVKFIGIADNVIEPQAAHALTDCDFIFHAADQHLARMLFNVICHQYLIPGIQLGTRIDVDQRTGSVDDIRSNLRLVLPRHGCLRCARLIDPAKIQDEAVGKAERERNRYVEEVPAPSVITFNTSLAAAAVTDFMLMMGSLIDDTAPLDYLLTRPLRRRTEPVQALPSRPDCKDCGSVSRSRRARGDRRSLPLPERR